MINEDIQPGYAPKEISFGGYTTHNLHHVPEAAKAFQDTIVRVGSTKHRQQVIDALRATDQYMKLNDMHLKQGKRPDEVELSKWRLAHQQARAALQSVGEFSHHFDYWHNHEHELQDMLTNYTPDTAGAEMTESYNSQGNVEEYPTKDQYTYIDEGLTDKTIRSGDKIKIARVIADMLGVENAESLSPDAAVNQGLRKIKNKRLTPEFVNTIKKMIQLAQEVGIKVDHSIIPTTVGEAVMEEPTVKRSSTRNGASGIIKFNDYVKLSKVNNGEVPANKFSKDGPNEETAPDKDCNDTQSNVITQVGSSLTHPADDQLRRRKVMYKTEEVSVDEDVQSADFKVSPVTGRKYRARHINFAASRMDATPDPSQPTNDDKKTAKTKPMVIRIGEETENISDAELDRYADGINTEDDILDAYDDNELIIIDASSGEEIKDGIDEQHLNEVLSRMERMKSKIRFARTQSKRERKIQIALRTRSSSAKINSRARKLAINLLKQRIAKKPITQLTVAEKERIEAVIEKRKSVINRLAMKLAPKIRKIENERLSHAKITK